MQQILKVILEKDNKIIMNWQMLYYLSENVFINDYFYYIFILFVFSLKTCESMITSLWLISQ